jgi:hypothetical protein
LVYGDTGRYDENSVYSFDETLEKCEKSMIDGNPVVLALLEHQIFDGVNLFTSYYTYTAFFEKDGMKYFIYADLSVEISPDEFVKTVAGYFVENPADYVPTYLYPVPRIGVTYGADDPG